MRMIARHAQQFSARPCGFKENAMLGLLLKMAENNVDPVVEKSQELNVTVNVNQSDQLEYDDVDEGKLIEVIREFRVLYDSSAANSKESAIKKEHAWAQVAEIMRANVLTCQRKWKNLRDGYSRELRKVRYSQSAGGPPEQMYISRWRYFDNLNFLRRYIKHRENAKDGQFSLETIYSLENAAEDCILKQVASEDIETYCSPPLRRGDPDTPNTVFISKDDENENKESTSSEADVVSSVPAKRPRNVMFPNSKTPMRHMSSTSTLASISTSPEGALVPVGFDTIRQQAYLQRNFEQYPIEADQDGDRMFCISLLPQLKKLDRRRKQLAKLKIMQVLYDVEFGNNLK